MSVHLPNHFGFERSSNTVPAKNLLLSLLGKNRLANVAVGLGVMAAVTMTERKLDPAKTGFALEWAVLSIVALLSFVLLAKLVKVTTRFLKTNFGYFIFNSKNTFP